MSIYLALRYSTILAYLLRLDQSFRRPQNHKLLRISTCYTTCRATCCQGPFVTLLRTLAKRPLLVPPTPSPRMSMAIALSRLAVSPPFAGHHPVTCRVAPIVVVDPYDVIFTKVAAGLNLDNL